MSDVVSYQVEGHIAVMTINNPPVNVLSPGVPEGIAEGVKRANADDTVQAIVLIGGGRSFIAGADINTFNLPAGQQPDVVGMIGTVENSAKPVVAAIHGNALGGGLETALACHYRVAAVGAKLGQPEVKLGIIPGAGGTQRLPRVVGLEAALEMIVRGDPISAERALEIGLVSELIEGDLLTAALSFTEGIAGQGFVKTSALEVGSAMPVEQVLMFARSETKKKARGMRAPLRCIDAVEAATTLPFAAGLKREREIFIDCVQSLESKALRHIFFAERRAAKVDGLAKDVAIKDIKEAAVIGAGTMGGGIAMNFANASIPVKILDVSQENLDKGLAIIKKNYASTVSKGRLSEQQMAERMNLITGVLDYDALGEADIIIEAVFEKLSLKKQIFSKLDEVAKDGAILASNTSTLDVNEIASMTKRPEAVLGTHFFSPANVMKLLEVVRADKTSLEALASTLTLAKRIRKVPVVVGVCDGFVGNRMIHVYGREAGFLLEEGALPQQVDRVMTDFGMAMGPFAMSDMAGLDIGYSIRQEQAATRSAERYSRLGDKIVELGRLGQKTSAGYYRYEAGKRQPLPDPEIEALIVAESEAIGMTRRELSDEEILKRLLYQLVNEGAKILEEGIAQRPSDIDVIYVYGYGFPPHRGGPMFYADAVGLDKVYADIQGYYQQHGDSWRPADLLAQLAREGGSFADH